MSFAADAFLAPPRMRVDGHTHFTRLVVPRFLRRGASVYDVGGGVSPFIPVDVKKSLFLRVTGLDIDGHALSRAPEGAYDRSVGADICEYRGEGDADIVICIAVLEHVRDAGEAFAGLASVLRPGGAGLVFVPCRNALFARINMLLPQRLTKVLLSSDHHQEGGRMGFPAVYDRCTPGYFRTIARRAGCGSDGLDPTISVRTSRRCFQRTSPGGRSAPVLRALSARTRRRASA